MGRKRLVDTDQLFFKPKLVKAIGADGLLIYIRLWGLAEDWGGLEIDADEISLQTGALRYSTELVFNTIEKLVQIGKLIPYEINGREYHWIKNLLEYQPLNNPTPPKLPLPSWISCEIKEYRSGKKYAKYTIDHKKIPVDYEETTNKLPVALETKRNRIETETETTGKGNETVTEGNQVNCREIPYSTIIEYLNKKAGTRYSPKTPINQRLIRTRWKEGNRIPDFEKVIDNQVREWKNDRSMAKYLRPQTLFGTKFESYLNNNGASTAIGEWLQDEI